MRMLRYTIAIGLLAGLGACSNLMGEKSSGLPRSSAVTQPTVAPDMVRQVQAKLRDDGYYRQGAVDGVWGSGTEAAVRSFQHDHNMASTGQLDVPTLQALNLTSGSAATGNTVTNEPGNVSSPAQPARTNPSVDTSASDNTTAPRSR